MSEWDSLTHDEIEQLKDASVDVLERLFERMRGLPALSAPMCSTMVLTSVIAYIIWKSANRTLGKEDRLRIANRLWDVCVAQGHERLERQIISLDDMVPPAGTKAH